MALTQEGKQESINVSIKSSVICKHTAFVAVHQEKKQPIGAITMYDIIVGSLDSPSPSPGGCFWSFGGARNYSPSNESVVASVESNIMDMNAVIQSISSKRYSAAASTSDSLMILISLQHAAGYWLLKDLSEKVVKKSLTELQCPIGLSQEVWATVLALVFLEQKCGHQIDEWELIAAKAEMWLSSQALPLSLESLKDNA